MYNTNIHEKIEQGLIDSADAYDMDEEKLLRGFFDNTYSDMAEATYETAKPDGKKNQASESWLIY